MKCRDCAYFIKKKGRKKGYCYLHRDWKYPDDECPLGVGVVI